MSIVDLIQWSADRFADRTAFVTDTATRSFSEIDRRANSLANALIENGVRKGDRVGVIIANQMEYPEAEIAIAKAGAVRVPMLIASSQEEIRRYIEFAETRIVFASGDGLKHLRNLATMPDAPISSNSIIAIGETESDELEYEQLIASTHDKRPAITLRDDDLYAVRFTGGTTGLPKGIMMDHRCMTNVINNVLLNWQVGYDEVVCHVHPLSHASGKIMYTWWMRGARQIILPAFRFDPVRLLETIETEQVTTIFMIPTAINMLLDCGRIEDFDVSSLRRIIYGGAPMPVRRVTEALDALGPVLYQIYGSSEAPNMLTTLTPEDHQFHDESPARLRSAGRPAYNVEMKIVDENGNDCPPNEQGEILSRGPHTMRGYWKDPELTTRRKVDGWVYTGDIGRWDEDGYLYIVDRKDDVIISGGFNIWPAEIETAICFNPNVAEAAVFGLPDPKWGEIVVAVIAMKPGKSVTLEEILSELGERLPRHKRPKRIEFSTDPLPKSSVGKILRREVARKTSMSTTVNNGSVSGCN